MSDFNVTSGRFIGKFSFNVAKQIVKEKAMAFNSSVLHTQGIFFKEESNMRFYVGRINFSNEENKEFTIEFLTTHKDYYITEDVTTLMSEMINYLNKVRDMMNKDVYGPLSVFWERKTNSIGNGIIGEIFKEDDRNNGKSFGKVIMVDKIPKISFEDNFKQYTLDEIGAVELILKDVIQNRKV